MVKAVAWIVLVLVSAFVQTTLCFQYGVPNGTVICTGTNKRFTSQPGNYGNLKLLYGNNRNCTFIDGNLEITFLESQDEDYDLSFLSSIQVVTGYVLIAFVNVRAIPLHSLTVIRGMNLLMMNEHGDEEEAGFSLYVTLNYDKNNPRVGLEELQFNNLHDVLQGNIRIFDNRVLCFDDTILWNDIISPSSKLILGNSGVTCPSCHESCDGHCWGAGPDMCQALTKTVCSATCDHRCYGPTADKCCHKECAGGCSGGTANECFACMNFNNDGTCVEYCPRRFKYNPMLYINEPNPEGKYSYASLCVPECPKNFLSYDVQESCLPQCPVDYHPDTAGERCIRCEGACPQACPGNDEKDNRNKYINGNNIKSFAGCTVIQGSLTILSSSFQYDPHFNISALTIEDLDNLKDIQKITGFLSIMGTELTNLTFFSNLRFIRGRTLTDRNAAFEAINTKLTSLDLQSLEEIYGHVVIANNKQLCYMDKIDMSVVGVEKRFFYTEGNADPDFCINRMCHAECSRHGCWGPGANNCLRCEHRSMDDICVSWCDPALGVFEGDNKICHHCDEQCKLECTGLGPTKCLKCKNVKDGPYCTDKCPHMKYLLGSNMTCEPCHALCNNEENRCTGPGSYVGQGGCTSCEMAVRKETPDGVVYQCIDPMVGCPARHFQKFITYGRDGEVEKNLLQKMVCYKCHSQCDTCHGEGPSNCYNCTDVRFSGECRTECPTDYYPDEFKECQKCHKHCRKGCYGGLASHCNACLHTLVYQEGSNNTLFNCTAECPADYLYTYTHEETGDTICTMVDPDGAKNLDIIIGVSCGVAGLVIVLIGLICLGFLMRQRARSKERTAQLTAKMQGLDESEEPLTPSNACPDLSKLRLIKESELRQGSIIGSGAFGTVYKGVWIPENENVKIPVAIKVLQEGTSPNQNQELLEEARVMASVEHIYCVRILAVCMTAQMMLVTQLMPLGCLLDYVRKHRENIGSKTLLNWCTQIAKGMAYLEGRGIVHRDLAARNVLVQNSNVVKITDFGLAKVLEYEESEYHAAGGKMPIKWLALECIQHRLFTHKTDVWSFGVTLWELFTYGQKPYENVRARDVPELLEKGERLVQPTICTIDVYMIMIKCWMLDADSRPSFAELADEFAKMARDPGRYLVIKGDRLMRLPSQSYDAHDVMRSLSVATDGPEDVVDAEEYLQPSEYHGDTEPSSPVSPFPPAYRGSLTKKPLLEGDESRPARTNYYPKRDKKYGALEAAAAAKNESRQGRDRVDSLHSRYCVDPLSRQMLMSVRETEEGVEEGAPLMEDTSYMPQAPPVPLAVDEDDYLQPRSQCPQYIDIDDNEKIEMQDIKKPKADYENIQDKPVKIDIMSALDNPEYFDSIPSSETQNNSKPQTNGNSRNKHDYYNELDMKGKGNNTMNV